MPKTFYLTSILLLFFASTAVAQENSLRQKIEQIISQYNADIGVSFSGIESNDTLSINGSKSYPILSVFKFHLALTILNKVDKKELSLTQKLFIKKSDLLSNTVSPIRDKYPNGNIWLSLADVLTYTVSQSDNNGCDILLRLIGGPATVQNYIHQIGVKDFIAKVNEEEMHQGFDVQRLNTTTPLAATRLLKKFYSKNILRKKSTDFLRKIMTQTSTGKNRIKGQLPEETVVAHKTGTSDTNEEGLTIAVNDIGIVTLPGRKHFAISIFVSNSKESSDTNEKIISDITKLTWDYFLNNIK